MDERAKLSVVARGLACLAMRMIKHLDQSPYMLSSISVLLQEIRETAVSYTVEDDYNKYVHEYLMDEEIKALVDRYDITI